MSSSDDEYIEDEWEEEPFQQRTSSSSRDEQDGKMRNIGVSEEGECARCAGICTDSCVSLCDGTVCMMLGASAVIGAVILISVFTKPSPDDRRGVKDPSKLPFAATGTCTPNRSKFGSAPNSVDVVYLWVNGSDPIRRRDYASATKQKKLEYNPSSARFREDGLFEYVVRSLLAATQLMHRVRNIYIITSGEVPSWLKMHPEFRQPFHEIRPSMPSIPIETLRRSFVNSPKGSTEHTSSTASSRSSGSDSTTSTTITTAAESTTSASPSATTATNSGEATFSTIANTAFPSSSSSAATTSLSLQSISSTPRKPPVRHLYLVPHALIFDESDLPTFNSNAVLAAVHRIPGIGDWIIYSDDDIILADSSITMSAFWSRSGAQRIYLQESRTAANVMHSSNNWQQAMIRMSAALDALCVTTARSSRRSRHHRHGPPWTYQKPQHVPILMSVPVLRRMEALWPAQFKTTRSNRLRSENDFELNFLYSHYVQILGYPVELVPVYQQRVRFKFLSHCATVTGARSCAVALAQKPNFLCFNDQQSSRQTHELGAATVRKILEARFGSFVHTLEIEQSSRMRVTAGTTNMSSEHRYAHASLPSA